MKKVIMYTLLLGMAILFPVQGEDVGRLLPVEVIGIYKDEDTVVLITDVGETGMGKTVDAAIENMKATTPGVIFLDTADYLLIDESAKDEVETLRAYLKPGMRVVATKGEIELKEAAGYLSVHKPAMRLRYYKDGEKGEILTKENGRLTLKEK